MSGPLTPVFPQWFTAQRLAGLPGMPSSDRKVRAKAQRLCWESRQKECGKGLEYNINSLPEATQVYLAQQAVSRQAAEAAASKTLDELVEELADQPEPEVGFDRDDAWDKYAHANATHKEQAAERLKVIREVEFLIDAGWRKTAALKEAARHCKWDWRSISRWRSSLKGIDKHDWIAALCSDYRAGGRPSQPIHPSVLRAFIKLFYRPEQPSAMSVWRKLQRPCAEKNVELPSAKRLKRASESELPKAQRVFMREGTKGLLAMYPKLDRSVIGLHALDWINGDGYQHNVMVRWPDGEEKRPTLWVWQCVYSRRIVGWAIDKTENTDLIRRAFLNMARQFGLPNHILLDNTMAAANKELTGGMAHRLRGKVREDEPLGAWLIAGIEVHTTSVEDGQGYAWAKPVERAFGKGGLGEIVDKDYALRGAYLGPNTTQKPSNYGERCVPLDVFLEVVDRGIAEYNARADRRTEMGRGTFSLDEVFKSSYENTAPIIPTRHQMRLFEFMSEEATVGRNGTVSIRAGAIVGKGEKGRNRYRAPELWERAGERVRIWVDPENLHGTADIYSADGRFVCEAECHEPAGFADRERGRSHNRDRRTWMSLEKKAAKLYEKVEDALADELLSPSTPDPIELDRRLVRPFRPREESITRPRRHEQTLSEAQQADIASTIAQIGTELNALNNATVVVDRTNVTECVLLFGKLVCELADGIAITEELQAFYEWFESDSGFMPTYDLMKDDIDFASGGLPKGRAAGAEKSPQ